MINQEEHISLWEECKSVFMQTKNTNTDELLYKVVNIIKKYKEILITVADEDFLDYITHMKTSDFITGTNGDDYEGLCDDYAKKVECNLDEIWRILSQLVWDLSGMVSSNVCPRCRVDHLAYYTDKSNTHLYESCLGCFSTWEDSKLIMRPEEIFPAPKAVLSKFQII